MSYYVVDVLHLWVFVFFFVFLEVLENVISRVEEFLVFDKIVLVHWQKIIRRNKFRGPFRLPVHSPHIIYVL